MLSGLCWAYARRVGSALFVFSALSLTWGISPAVAVLPQMPQTYIDTATVPITTGTTWSVGAGGNFQAALNAAKPGDMIVLQAGAVFRGPFTLPNKASGTGWITVRTSTPDRSFPAPGTRVTPVQTPLMPRLVAGSGSVLTTAAGAHHYRFIGVEVSPAPGVFLYNLITLASPDGSAAGLPHDIIFDRSYLHGDPVKGTRRGIALNSGATAVIDSHLSDFKEVGADSQAICGWNGPGPFKIVNNYLEGAGENVMFGGADPSIPNLVPSDIEIRRNHFAKPLAWKIGHPEYAGTPWSVKNLFELKNARRVLIEGNLLERSWVHAQTGFAILFTPRNQNGAAPWSAVQDVTFRNNIVRHTAGGINILGTDNLQSSQPVQRIQISNNLLYDVSSTNWGTNGRGFQVLTNTVAPVDVVIEHNTALMTYLTILFSGTAPAPPITFRNNLVGFGRYGIAGDSGKGSGLAGINYYVPGSVFSTNVFANNGSALGWPPSNYPATSLFAANVAAVGFMDAANDNYQLATGSPYHKAATDGKDIGVDFAALAAAFGGSGSTGAGTGTGEGTTGGGTTSGGATSSGGTTALTVGITAPQAGSTVSHSVTVSGTASSAASRISLILDGSIVAMVGGRTARHLWDTTTSPNGTHTWTAKAYDASGNSVSSAPASVVVQNSTGGGDTTAPRVAITQPVNSGTVARNSKVSITAAASDSVGVTRVGFYVNGKLTCSDTTSPYACVWQVPATSGKTYSVQAKAYDAAGKVGSSGIVTVTAR